METKINAKRIREILSGCFFSKTPNIGSKAIYVEGIMNKFVFDPEKVLKFEGEVIAMLDELDENIREDSEGKGVSLIVIPVDKHGNQWGEQRNADELMVPGMAIGRIKYLMENRIFWRIMPGGVPYYVYTTEKFEPKTIEFSQELIDKMNMEDENV